MRRKISDYERIYVHKDFKKALKMGAIEKGLTVMKFTESLGKEKQRKNEFKPFEFRF